MDAEDYYHPYHGKDDFFRYFAENPIRKWPYSFFKTFFEQRTNPPSDKTILSAYLRSMHAIKNNNSTPASIKSKTMELLNSLHNTLSETNLPSNVCYVNHGGDQVISSVNNSTINISHETDKVGQEKLFKKVNIFNDDDDDDDDDDIPSTLPQPLPSDFRQKSFAFATKALSNPLTLWDAVELQKLIDSFTPTTVAEHVDLMTSKLALKVNLHNIIEVSAIKWSMSRIICLVNTDIAAIFKKYLPDEIFKRISKEKFSFEAGISSSSKKLFNDIIAKSRTDGRLNEKSLRVSISKEKTAKLENDDIEGVEILDIMDTVIGSSLSSRVKDPNKNESELTTYRRFSKVLDYILDSTMLQAIDGETICNATRKVAKNHRRLYGNTIPRSNGFGRKIDLIIATKKIELSSSEWKKKSVSARKCLHQQNKNVRVNKSILCELLQLPIDENDKKNLFVIGIDFVGNLGYLFAVKRYQNVYFANIINSLTIPTYLDQFPSFVDTLDNLYLWRNQHIFLEEMILPAFEKMEEKNILTSILGSSSQLADTDSSMSPNIYLTPSKKRKIGLSKEALPNYELASDSDDETEDEK